jgi:hypothetical protein
VLATAGGAAVSFLNHDEPTVNPIPADTDEWLLGHMDDTELAEAVRERQSQHGDAIEVALDRLRGRFAAAKPGETRGETRDVPRNLSAKSLG